MRLSPDVEQAIRNAFQATFLPGDRVLLFGSRIDDSRRGGDIDLYIETSATPTEASRRKIKLGAQLLRALDERKVDLVVHPQGVPDRPIDQQAKINGIELWQIPSS